MKKISFALVCALAFSTAYIDVASAYSRSSGSRSSSHSVSSSNRFSSSSSSSYTRPSVSYSAPTRVVVSKPTYVAPVVQKPRPVMPNPTVTPYTPKRVLAVSTPSSYNVKPLQQPKQKTVIVNNYNTGHHNDGYRSSGPDLLSTAIVAAAVVSVANSANANQNVQQNVSSKPVVQPFNFMNDCNQWVCD
jgi:hypothetical protein